jgi:hypothetical protein
MDSLLCTPPLFTAGLWVGFAAIERKKLPGSRFSPFQDQCWILCNRLMFKVLQRC